MIFAVARAAVCFDAAVARILVEAGLSVVVCGTGGDALGRVAAELRTEGRLSVLTADPDDGDDLAIAVTMATELFGSEPVVVRTLDQASQIAVAGPAGPGGQ